jgi:hypothetical protein
MKDLIKDVWNKILVSVGWSDRQAIVFLFFLWLFIIMPLLIETSALNNALLWLTGIIILLYTVETHGLRVEMVRQNELAVQPLVTVCIERRQADDCQELKDVLVFRNIGRGPALFVEPEGIQFEQERFTVRFDAIDVIEAGKERIAGVNLNMEGEHSLSFIEHLDPRYAQNTYNMTIAYEDTDGQPHGSLVQMGKNGTRLLGHSRLQ